MVRTVMNTNGRCLAANRWLTLTPGNLSQCSTVCSSANDNDQDMKYFHEAGHSSSHPPPASSSSLFHECVYYVLKLDTRMLLRTKRTTKHSAPSSRGSRETGFSVKISQTMYRRMYSWVNFSQIYNSCLNSSYFEIVFRPPHANLPAFEYHLSIFNMVIGLFCGPGQKVLKSHGKLITIE